MKKSRINNINEPKGKLNTIDTSVTYEKSAIILIWVGFGIIIAATVLYALKSTMPSFVEHFGQYGELVGGFVGSLWSLAGVILFYEALRFQRTELKMQRHELELQRHEIMEQTEQQRMQNEQLAYQNFENTFFQMMSLHNEIVESINLEIHESTMVGDGSVKSRKISGRDCFIEYYKIFRRFLHYNLEEVRFKDLDNAMALELIDNAYNLFFEESQANLGHYFRNLFAIVKFVNSNNRKEKQFHIDLIRAQLSNYELLLMYFHCITVGTEFKPMIEKYGFFRALPHDEIVTLTKGLYAQSAFGE